MQRRLSSSAQMAPTLAVLHDDMQPERPAPLTYAELTHVRNISDVNSAQQQLSQRPPPYVASQPQQEVSWNHQPPQQTSMTQQSHNRQFSFANSMDLMSSTNATSTTTHAYGQLYQPLAQSSVSLQKDLFTSSSHHTSHTVAAGDLLTMSRRALDPSVPTHVKRRCGTMAESTEGGANHFNFKKTFRQCHSDPNQVLYPVQQQQQRQQQQYQQQQQQLQQPQQQQMIFPHHGSSLEYKGEYTEKFSSGNDTPSSAVWAVADALGSGDESHQDDHRTIRRCRRSDSFEMMDDG
jgi:hypothetical protein